MNTDALRKVDAASNLAGRRTRPAGQAAHLQVHHQDHHYEQDLQDHHQDHLHHCEHDQDHSHKPGHHLILLFLVVITSMTSVAVRNINDEYHSDHH